MTSSFRLGARTVFERFGLRFQTEGLNLKLVRIEKSWLRVQDWALGLRSERVSTLELRFMIQASSLPALRPSNVVLRGFAFEGVSDTIDFNYSSPL